MNEVIRMNTTVESGEKPVLDIEDAVLVEEENESSESQEVHITSVEETIEDELDKLPDIDESRNLEEINSDFALVKDEFLSLVGEETNETIKSGKTILVLFDRVSKSDETVEKNIKLKYLKGLNLCVEELKSNNSDNVESQKEESSIELPVEKTTDPENDENKDYQIAREEWKKTKESHREKKQEYDNALSEFYGNQSNFDKSINSVKKFFGFNPELPPEIIKLEEAYKSERNKYAVGLNSALKERGKLSYKSEDENGESIEIKNKLYDEKVDSSKIAFVNKFILKPNQELLAKQEANLLSETQKETLVRISQKLGKHKWHLRGGMVVIAGIAGSVTGAGLAVGAGWQAWKIATGIMAGVGAGTLTKKAMQGRVDRAEHDVEKQTLKFDVNKLDVLEQDLLEAVEIRDKNLRQQKVASIAAAVIAGGTTAYSLSGVSAGEVASAVTDNTDPTVDVLSKEIGRVIEEHTGLQTMVGDKVVADPLSEAVASSFEMPIKETITIPRYLPNDVVDSYTDVTGLKIISQGNLLEDVTELQRDSVEKYIKLTVSDQLSAHPNISQENLENVLFTKLESKFGANEWWKEAQIKKIEIGSIEKNDVLENSEKIATDTSAEALSTENDRIIEVEKGDNLWNIIKIHYSMELNGLSTVEQNQVIDKLLDRVNNNPDLLRSMNIRSGDIDTIYPNDKINIGVLESELKTLVDLEKNDAEVSYTKSSSLDVKTDDPEVNKVKITFATNPVKLDVPSDPINPVNILEKTSTPVTPLEVVNIEEVKIEVEPPVPSRVEILNTGNYFNTKEYQEYILKVFGNEKNFNSALNNEVVNVDRYAYDFFNKGMYKSFYEVYGTLPLSEFSHFQQLDRGQIITLLNENNIKYEAYLAWQDKINSLVNNPNIPHTPKTTIADLFSRFVVENKAMQLKK